MSTLKVKMKMKEVNIVFFPSWTHVFSLSNSRVKYKSDKIVLNTVGTIIRVIFHQVNIYTNVCVCVNLSLLSHTLSRLSCLYWLSTGTLSSSKNLPFHKSLAVTSDTDDLWNHWFQFLWSSHVSDSVCMCVRCACQFLSMCGQRGSVSDYSRFVAARVPHRRLARPQFCRRHLSAITLRLLTTKSFHTAIIFYTIPGSTSTKFTTL